MIKYALRHVDGDYVTVRAAFDGSYCVYYICGYGDEDVYMKSETTFLQKIIDGTAPRNYDLDLSYIHPDRDKLSIVPIGFP